MLVWERERAPMSQAALNIHLESYVENSQCSYFTRCFGCCCCSHSLSHCFIIHRVSSHSLFFNSESFVCWATYSVCSLSPGGCWFEIHSVKYSCNLGERRFHVLLGPWLWLLCFVSFFFIWSFSVVNEIQWRILPPCLASSFECLRKLSFSPTPFLMKFSARRVKSFLINDLLTWFMLL